MKKRKWLFVGAAVAAVIQFFIEGLWHEILFRNSYGDLQPIQRASPLLLFNFLSEFFFALVVGFFYLHVPAEKRSMRTGIVIGGILGLLISLYQFLDWYGSFTISAEIILLEIIKTSILSIVCGISISFTEKKLKIDNS